jgi:hypothetical protein
VDVVAALGRWQLGIRSAAGAGELRRLPEFTRLRWMCVALYLADRTIWTSTRPAGSRRL